MLRLVLPSSRLLGCSASGVGKDEGGEVGREVRCWESVGRVAGGRFGFPLLL